MMNPPASIDKNILEPYRLFCEITAGYRLFFVLNQAVKSGLIEALSSSPLTADELLKQTSICYHEGLRFLELLVTTGFLLKNGEQQYALSGFSRSYLLKNSPTSQLAVLEFEPVLMQNWSRIGEVLHNGQGTLVEQMSEQECSVRLNMFQKAMANAAAVRAVELWRSLPQLPEHGKIIDIGAGDGVYLNAFLETHPYWSALACDLEAVCKRLQQQQHKHSTVIDVQHLNIIDFFEMDVFAVKHRGSADILLLSNICHCYSFDENRQLLHQIRGLLKSDGLLIVHDFFRDSDSFGAMYDIHLMVNTYNGRCFSTVEMMGMLHDSGFVLQSKLQLSSGSVAFLCGGL